MEIPRFGVPVDAAQWGAVALGGVLLAWSARLLRTAQRRALRAPSGGLRGAPSSYGAPEHERLVVAGLAVIAGLLSWGYVVAYLRGGPRIIDATSYYLEARGFAAGRVVFPVGEAETSVLGRFLVRSETSAGVGAAVLFPPGYPALLAIGFLAGAPLLVGPLLAAMIVIATYALAREVVASARTGDRGAVSGGGESAGSSQFEGVPVIAAGLSAACGAMRYHTAETMSHGLAALCFAGAVTFLLRAVRRGAEPRRALVCAAIGGAFGGWLFATRPASGLALAVVAALLLFADRLGNKVRRANARASLGERAKLLGAAILGAAPFVVGLVVHQRLATGAWWTGTHAAHYALNDGPAGCFRYGFGEGIGCFGEHGDFVRANLPHGFGFVAAVKTTARRLWMHLVDAGNLELCALLVPWGAVIAWRLRGARVIAAAIAALSAAYAPFYFDGNYPGGGGRMFADGLPFEHVLMAIAAVGIAQRIARRGSKTRGSEEPWPEVGHVAGAWIVGVSLIGFGVRAGFDHAQLRDRDGGAPAFLEGDPARPVPPKGLVFVDSDAAFNLMFDPGERSGWTIARRKGDAIDAFVKGEPIAGSAWIEGGSLWPPTAQEGGAYALPAFAGGTCAKAGRLLRVLRSAKEGDRAKGVRARIPARMAGGRVVEVEMLAGPSGAPGATGRVSIVVDGVETAGEIALPAGGAAECRRGVTARVPAGAKLVEIVIVPQWQGVFDPEEQPLLAVDRVTLRDGD